MGLGLTHRKSQDWRLAMDQLSRQATKAGADTFQLQAEARRLTDAYLARRLKTSDLTAKHEHMDKQVARLKRQVPLAAAFVEEAEAPRRHVEEHRMLRARADSSADAALTGNPTAALTLLRPARRSTVRRGAMAVPPQAAGDIPRLLACGTLANNDRLAEAIRSAGALLVDFAKRDPEALIIEPAVARAVFGRLLDRIARCDRLYTHRTTDQALPLVQDLLAREAIFSLDEKATGLLSDALNAAPHDPNAYDMLRQLATRLSREDSDAAPLVRLLADRRLKDAYWALYEDDEPQDAPPSLTPDTSVKWALAKVCEDALQTFYRNQADVYRTAFNNSPQARTTRFENIYFNAEQCLGALDRAGLLRERSDLHVIAVLHYFLEEIYMFPEA